jgi:adenylate cyclase
LEVSAQLRKEVEVLKPKVYGGEDRTINVEEVRQLVSIVFRLEALSSSKIAAGRHREMTETPYPGDQVSLEPVISVDRINVSLADSGLLQSGTYQDQSVPHDSANLMSPTAIMGVSPSNVMHLTSHLGPRVSEEMTDEELTAVLESLVTRLENTLSTLVSTIRPPSCDATEP